MFRKIVLSILFINCFICGSIFSQQFIFDFTGGDQSFTVPAGVTCLDVKMWGGGGGSADNSNGGYGGGAAFVGGRLNVTPGQVLTIRVGGGGAAGTTGGNAANGSSAFPNGGVGRRQARGGGNGGGFSAIFLGTNPLAIAGGGGGGAGSGSSSGNGTNYCGGVGAQVGQNGTRGGERNGCATGAGGCGGNANGTNNNCLSPSSTFANGYQGGNGESGGFTYGGGGGGGGYAGGQGGASGGNNSGGGGGGSSFFSGTQLNSASGNTNNAGNQNDPLNLGAYGRGGARSGSGSGNTGNAGQNGRIVLIVANQTTPTFSGIPNAVCPGNPVPSLPTTSNEGITGTWSPATINTAQTTTYTFTPSGSSCANTAQVTITGGLDATISTSNGVNTICPGGTVVLNVASGSSYQWFQNGNAIPGATSQTYPATQSGSYSVTVDYGSCQLTSNNFVLNTDPTGCGSDTIIYDYTGGDQTFDVPAGVTCIDVLLWGAGGGSGDNTDGGNGGGGAFVRGSVGVTPGQTLTVMVGGGGSKGSVSGGGNYQMTSVYGGGGRGRSENRGGGGGGGRSAIRLGTAEWATAAGGGGGAGSGSSGGDGTRYCGGGGGALNGNGTRGGDRSGCSTGAGGCGGTPTAPQSCTGGADGTQFIGGDGEDIGNQTYGGGGGGSGYYGGEGGATGGNNSGGGGGGSSYILPTAISVSSDAGSSGGTGGNATTAAGNWTNSLNQSLYGGGGGRGGSNQDNSGNQGQNGRIVIILSNSISPTFNGIPTIVCQNASAPSLPTTSNEGITGNWSPATINTSQTTTYTFTPNPQFCAQSVQITINVPQNPVISSSGGNNVICTGQTINLSATGGTSYQWQLNGVDISGATNSTFVASQGGNYTVTAFNGSCSNSSAVFVLTLFNPTVSGTGGSTQICPGGTLVLTATNGVSYQWQLNGVNIPGATASSYTANGPGVYNVVVNNGICSSTSANFVLTEIVNPTININVSSPSACIPTTGTVSSDGNFTNITWFINSAQASTSPSFSFQFTSPGCYIISANGTLNNGCNVIVTDSAAICLDELPFALFSASPFSFSAEAETINFTNQSSENTVSYNWNFGNGSSSLDSNAMQTFYNTENGYTVTLTAYTENGCSDDYSLNIPFDPESVFYIPNSFTPDGDGFNQVFKPIFTFGYDPFNFEMLIYNRWGELIFESRNANIGWDGSYGNFGRSVQQGIYTYKITFKNPNRDERQIVSGHVTLIR
jgi:gliding motility-associated-like protein